MLQKESLGSVKFISINRKSLLLKLKKIAKSIKMKHCEVIDIRLFGSIATKEETGTSDVDILIILTETDETFFQRILKYKRYFDIEISIDLLVYTNDEIKKMNNEKNFFIRKIMNNSFSLLKNK